MSVSRWKSLLNPPQFRHGVPHGTVKGRQKDSGEYHMVVCHHTTHGNIPGKSNGEKGWYSYDGKELETHDFSFVVVRKNCESKFMAFFFGLNSHSTTKLY